MLHIDNLINDLEPQKSEPLETYAGLKNEKDIEEQKSLEQESEAETNGNNNTDL